MKEKRDEIQSEVNVESRKKPKYEKPEVVTYSGDDLLKELGPASACTSPPFP